MFYFYYVLCVLAIVGLFLEKCLVNSMLEAQEHFRSHLQMRSQREQSGKSNVSKECETEREEVTRMP